MNVEKTKNDCTVNSCTELGKGEVDSSILSGSTRKPSDNAVFCFGAFAYPAVSSRTYTEGDAAERGESVDFVHCSIRGDDMTNDRKSAFELALEEAVIGCLGIGVHPAEMIEAMERKISDLKQMLASIPS